MKQRSASRKESFAAICRNKEMGPKQLGTVMEKRPQLRHFNLICVRRL